MSETWADAQFDMLEAAYDEVPIEAKARIAELERELRKSYDAQGVKAEELVKRDVLICEMARELRGLNDGGVPTDCMAYERRMRELGIEVD